MIIGRSLIGGCSLVLLILALGTSAEIASAQSIGAAAGSPQFNVLHRFSGPDGARPSSLVQASNGDFYGTTGYGGANAGTEPFSGAGTVFKITPTGTLTTLYNFCSQPGCADGEYPFGLIQATDGNFYGVTQDLSYCSIPGPSCGSIFKITPSCTLTTLHSFCTASACSDGYGPNPLIQAADRDLYGTTHAGGAYGAGTVFRITLAGQLTTLNSFCNSGPVTCPDGSQPNEGLVQGTDGDFYGTAGLGGLVFSYCGSGCGTIFKITPNGKITTLHSFCSQPDCTDGENSSSLIQATNGNLHGTTADGTGGVIPDGGTVFSSLCRKSERTACSRARLGRFIALQSRDR